MHEFSWMTPELESFRETVRRFCQEELVPKEPEWAERRCVDRDIWFKAAKIGLLCPGMPEEYGGGGGDFRFEAIAFTEQARAIAPGMSNNVHSGAVAHYILDFATEEQKRRWLPRMATGELVGAIAMTEPGTGSDLQSIKTRAVVDGDDYVVTGAKTYITNGTSANLICLVVKTDPSAGARGLSILVVETDGLDGIRRGKPLHKIGLHSQDTCELFFDGMRVPRANLLGGQEGQGFKQLMKELGRERLITALNAHAYMERAISETLTFVSDRNAFGQKLLSLQNTRFKLAECATQAKLAGVFLDDCVLKLMNGTLDATSIAMAKWWITETCGRVIDECLQLHGGSGYMTEFPIARIYQNVRVQRILAGANEIMKELIARDLEKQLA